MAQPAPMITGMELALLEMKLAVIRMEEQRAFDQARVDAYKARADATTRLANAYRAQAEARFQQSS